MKSGPCPCTVHTYAGARLSAISCTTFRAAFAFQWAALLTKKAQEKCIIPFKNYVNTNNTKGSSQKLKKVVWESLVKLTWKTKHLITSVAPPSVLEVYFFGSVGKFVWPVLPPHTL